MAVLLAVMRVALGLTSVVQRAPLMVERKVDLKAS